MSVFKSNPAEAGFTLLEILIAIVLLAFITLGVVNVTEDSINTHLRTNEYNEDNLQIETALSRFEWDFAQIYSPLYFTTPLNMNQNQVVPGADQGGQGGGGPDGQNVGGTAGGSAQPQFNPYLQAYYEQIRSRFERNERFSGVSKDGQPIPRFYAPEKNVFEFFTSSNRRKLENTPQSHFAWVRYGLIDQGNIENENPEIPKSLKSFVRYFSADDPYGDTRMETDQIKPAVLLKNVERLEFRFWDYQKRKWVTSLREIQQGENIVRGVKLMITWYDSQGKRYTERIFRPNWPMVTPVDPTPGQRPPANTGGAAGTQGGDPGENLDGP